MDYINVIVINMPIGLKGCTRLNSDGSYTVLINARYDDSEQEKTYLHEISHITNDDFFRCDINTAEQVARSAN